ncbi:hypothetical protein PHYSODRAFT_330102 [Phytophthora sojae]|uniref:Uncharacterized protein n=1 Tax=Phytophthora sojae (strain P6497) TaxID=1094619 RepID=G4Z478_PHYSP|nr:hypothetical protein PHYSODRAFT_330102 [Phytophthora sojae]EGZ22272.1 hypothetical protein PHYSODRAFT_330102 [Phytophthora sojae]|eukprot:XP_009524989.1 hypothetical protein PHYSODRAFT_330102 [Phytophthora sojae]
MQHTFSPCFIVQVGDALLGHSARVFVALLDFLAPSMSKNISWDYNPEDVGPIVPEWSGLAPDAKRDYPRAEFA